jgi:tetratricopeptide (TPR) repeat protein
MHVYRFTARDNAVATGHFRAALALDPHFARAHAGLSFARFQDAFTFYSEDRSAAMNEARASAERAIEIDPRDPFANFNLGRYHWLDHDLDAGRSHLERAVALNPNYAQGLYSLAFTNAVSGRAHEALGDVEQSLRLSPLDPLLYGMLGTRALSHLQEGDIAEAAHWGDRAARAPAAHFLIGMIAVATNEIHGDEIKARYWANLVKRRRPNATCAQFLRSFPFRNMSARKRMEAALEKNGF